MLTCINWLIQVTPSSNKLPRLQNMLTSIQHHPFIQADTEGNPGETSRYFDIKVAYRFNL